MQLRGELDVASDASLRDHLGCAARMSPDLVLDVREVEFMDCAALGALVWARNKVCAEGGRFATVAPRRLIRRLIDTAGLTETLHVCPDLRAALLATSYDRSVDV